MKGRNRNPIQSIRSLPGSLESTRDIMDRIVLHAARSRRAVSCALALAAIIVLAAHPAAAQYIQNGPPLIGSGYTGSAYEG